MDRAELQDRLADRYTLEEELGRGGMGTVFLARDLQLDRLVALKVLPAEYEANPDLHARFLRETRTAASFSHPNIVPVHAVVEREGILAYTMGLVEGESVAQRVARDGPLSVREIVRLLQDVGYALAYAHGRGVVHRDIKPDNIMLERATGRALLMDFGISRSMAAPTPGAGLTRVGEVVGTPEYMSPEQASGDVVDGRSDLYSLGLVAWFCTTGRTAMAAESTQKVLVKQLTERVPVVESVRPELPDALSAAIDRCIEKEPGDRFQTAEALVEAVENSQLAGPDIPLPVRTFASEVEGVTLLVFFLLIFAWFVATSIAALESWFDAVIPVIVLLSVATTRILQTYAEARTLAERGFTPDEVRDGLAAVYRERDDVRETKRLDPAAVANRRRSLRRGFGLVIGAVALAVLAFQFRVPVATGGYSTPLFAIIILYIACGMLGVGAAIVARSPFRPTLIERLARRLWLGPFGSAFLRRAAAGAPPQGIVARVAPLVTKPAVVPASSPPRPSPSTQPADGQASLAALDRRVRDLEAWRESEKRRR